MAEIRTLQSWREERILREAASLYERRASERLQRKAERKEEAKAKRPRKRTASKKKATGAGE